MSRLQKMGYRVPEDVIVTGFDYTFNAQNSCPALTTVKRPLYYSGQKACSILVGLMNNEPQPKSFDLEAEPVFTESCGCNEHETGGLHSFNRDANLRLGQVYTSVHMLNRLIAALAGAENIEECIESVEKMLKIIGCGDFSLCLAADWENAYNVAQIDNEQNKYSPLMTAPLVLVNGEKLSVKEFPVTQLHPVPLKTGGNISYFLPLHFDRRCLGYYIMTNNDFPISSLLCHTMTMCIGNAIDNLSKLNVLDPLCKIYNRNGFMKNADHIMKECLVEQRPLTMFFIDLDGLKIINDTYGHKEGDFAIKSTADAISYSCQSADVCGRFGGDEFVVLGRGGDYAGIFEEKLENRLSEINKSAGKPYLISASAGHITLVPQKSDSLFDIIQKADALMYEKKKQKRRK